ncbi:MAG: response regulator, partial [Candidatus Latescibacteria bacterium]|nr:response regulator [Candidatus Latescibacterota bacterium]
IDVATTFQEIPFVKATASDVSDILVNLMLNAVDAMPQGGEISIETQAVDGDVLLTFSDTGIGMEKNVQARVFEPFFTTKADVGTGLGLSTVYRAMVQWGGNITLVSEPNLGTTFTLRFPIWAESELSSDVVQTENVIANTVRSGKILVVEDEALVSQIFVRLLSQYHEVVTVTAGQQALDALDLAPYDVALIDLGLPDMPGDQVAKRIRHQDLAIVLVLITGWELESTDPRLLAFDFYVQKPIDDIGKILDIVSQAVALRAERAKK